MNLRLINQLKAIAARWGAGPAVAPVSASRILDTLMAASGASLTPGRVASFDHKLDALIASLGLTVTQPAGRFKKLAVVAGVEELLGSYDPRTVFGSDLVTWYGNSVDDLWAEHRACWEDSPELVVNGGFDSADGWTLGAGVTVTGGVLSFNTSTTQAATRASALPLVAGRAYRVGVTVTRVSGSVEVFVGNTVSGAANSTGTHSFVIVSSALNQNIQVRSLGAGVFTVDNLSVKEIDLSKSRLFSDNSGTTPITGLEQTVGLILDKSKGLELGGEKFSGFATLGSGWVVEADGSWSCVNTSGASSDARVDLPNTPGVWNRITFTVLENTLASNAVYPMNTSPLTLGVNPGRREFTSSPLGNSGTTRFFLFRVGPGSTLRISGISVRELPGHHLSQGTAAARGRLSARYNYRLSTDNLDLVWAKNNITVTPSDMSPDGPGFLLTPTEGASSATLRLNHTTSVGQRLRHRILARPGTTPYLLLNNDGVGNSGTFFDVQAGVIGSSQANSLNAQIRDVGDGWWECSMETIATGTTSGFTTVRPLVSLVSSAVSADAAIVVSAPDCRLVGLPSTVPPYQRVTSASDYDAVGFPVRLVTDGVDDRWVTGDIAMAGVTGFSVWASALRTGATDRRVLAAFGDAISDAVGFNLESADTGQTPPGFGLRVRTGGAGQLSVQPSVLGQPYAVYAEWDAGTQIGSSRLNGITAEPTPTSSGTAGLGSLQFAVGGRIGGTNGWFGDIFSLPMIVRRLATPEEITAAESAFGRTIGVLQ
jgi:hypothetical protein